MFQREQNTHLHLMSFHHIDMSQVVEIPSQVRKETTYSA